MQIKFSLSYICILAAVLILMNTYPLIVSENLVFQSKKSTLQGNVNLMVSSLSGLSELTEQNVNSALVLTEDAGISRVIVTDSAGTVLYDTEKKESLLGTESQEEEITHALRGKDAFFSAFVGGAFESRAASPVVFHSRIIGAVYAWERDTEQAILLQSLQSNLLTISVAVAVVALALSVLLSRALTRRFGKLLKAVEKIRDGGYGDHAEVGGEDEVARLATEVNRLSDRLKGTEESRRRFVSDASHELKTPLAGIRLMTDSILQTENMDSATVHEFVGDIAQEAERLTRITENLLRLTKLDSGVLAEAEPIAVAPVAERVARMLQLIAQEREVELSCSVLQEKTVLAGGDDLHQILYNLAENGIKYNRAGGFVRIAVSGEAGECVLTVEDNGIGIPEEDLPRIFDRFYRVDKMRSRAAGGTGLGLSIVADTVRRCGGTVTAEPRDGGGTRFTVCLPAI